MNTVSKILSISLLLSCVHSATINAAAAPTPTTNEVALTPHQLGVIASLEGKHKEKSSLLALRRTSLDGLTTQVSALARAMDGEQAELQREFSRNTAIITSANDEKDRAHKKFIAASQAFTKASDAWAAAEQKHTETTSKESDRHARARQTLEEKIATINSEIENLNQAIATKQQCINDIQDKQAQYEEQINRVRQGLPAKSGILGLGTFLGL